MSAWRAHAVLVTLLHPNMKIYRDNTYVIDQRIDPCSLSLSLSLCVSRCWSVRWGSSLGLFVVDSFGQLWTQTDKYFFRSKMAGTGSDLNSAEPKMAFR